MLGAVLNASLTRGHATEAALERELGRHRFVHLATHGFFTPPKLVRQFKDDQSAGGEKILLPAIPPGLSSGIVCAGVATSINVCVAGHVCGMPGFRWRYRR